MISQRKITPLIKIKPILNDLKQRGRKIVFTNGCFDIIHAGHIRYLEKAKGLGDVLVVGLNSDSSVKKIKGNNRPITPQGERAEVLSALEAVDYVVIFDEETPYSLIKNIEPDILVKGADWAVHKIVGADIIKATGGKIARIRFVKGRSTTNIIRKILNVYSAKT